MVAERTIVARASVGSWLNRLAHSGSTQQFDGPQGRGAAGFDTRLLEDFQQGLFHGESADAADDADVGVGLALGDPKEGFRDARSEAQCGLQRLGGGTLLTYWRDIGALQASKHLNFSPSRFARIASSRNSSIVE